MKTALGAIILGALLLSGCGTASKEDICGDCTGPVKEACEQTYDICNDDSDCIDELEDSEICS